jgi:SAM-dependent methyltransferase
MVDYDKTPSFYKTEEAFMKFLGQSSYYSALQNAVSKIVRLATPKTLVEFGAGTGATANRLAYENPECQVTGIDIREAMVDLARLTAPQNARFLKRDMVKYISEQERLPELILFLYAFHHIRDPLKTKRDLLRACKEKLPANGRICIADIFLPESFASVELDSLTKNRWSYRLLEGYSSTFWAALDGLAKQEVGRARDVGNFCAENEYKAGNLIMKRKNEYPVSMGWLIETAQEIGFSVDIAEPCNCIGDGVVLLSWPGERVV